VGSTPIPVTDYVPLSAIQIGLVLQVGRVYGEQITWGKAREVLLTLGGGAGLREVLRQLLKLVPIPVANWLVSGLYAAIGTAALGMAAREYWVRGGLGSPREWRHKAAGFRKQLWTRFRSAKLLRRIRSRKQAARLLEESLEEEIAGEEPETGAKPWETT
jgi:uncharacterized protein (DUF697 family)